MTETQQLIEQVREKLGGATDYRIAQVLDLHTKYLTDYKHGRPADPYACAKIAEILQRDPLHVIAQVEAEAARSEKKREYWRSIFSGLRRTAHGIALCGIVTGFGTGPSTGHATSGASSHNVYYVK